MNYTITCNPSLDYVMTVENLEMGKTNRSVRESVWPGGKGLNVSMVLQELGVESKALGFVAGFTGKEITRLLEMKKVHTDFVELDEGDSRINVKILQDESTEINASGPQVSKEKQRELFKRLEQLTGEDLLVLAGNISPGLGDDFYLRCMETVREREVPVIVDATGALLMETLKVHPFLVKPNHHELGELFGVEIDSCEMALQYALKLQEKGARNVLVSMGKMGAAFLGEDGTRLASKVLPGKAVNTVGAGDSMLAGFVAAWMERRDYAHCLRMGMAAGGAAAFSYGLPVRDDIMEAYRRISVTNLDRG